MSRRPLTGFGSITHRNGLLGAGIAGTSMTPYLARRGQGDRDNDEGAAPFCGPAPRSG
jgi:hypothetical protein